MKLYAVIGNPVSHSLSPKIHEYFARQCRQDMRYERIKTNDFAATVGAFFRAGGAGLNVTLPFKQQAFELEANQSKRCQLAKAVNTLWINASGQLCADNTDGIGLVRDLLKYTSIESKRLLVIGAGGAARGVIPALLEKRPSSICIVNRDLRKAKLLAEEFSLDCMPMSQAIVNYDVLLNATSASLQHSLPPLYCARLAPSVVAYDLAYLSEPTVFMNWAKKLGADTVVDGLGMLVEQAAESFALWREIMPGYRLRMNILEQLRAGLQA